jgi:Zn-dependent protease
VHWTFFILLLWIVFDELKHGATAESIFFNIAFVFAVFFCVVLHELGHAFVATYFGITTEKITLLPIGGMASFDKMPESSRQELLVVIAGPLVNALIALLLYFVVPVQDLMDQSFSEAYQVFKSFTFQNFLFYLFIVNIGLVIFNLIPAFPMDGGRIFRALLELKMNRMKATQIASSLGFVIAVAFFLIGILYNPFLVFIALFIFLGAYGENQMVQHLELLKGHSVEEAMLLDITTFNPEDSIDIVVNKIISGTENNFIVLEDGRISGVLYHKNIIENSNKNVLVKEVMELDFKVFEHTEDLKKVYLIMQAEQKSFYPVVFDKKLVGAIDATNLYEYLLFQEKLAY